MTNAFIIHGREELLGLDSAILVVHFPTFRKIQLKEYSNRTLKLIFRS